MAFTKEQLEALKNALLAGGQPITAATHRSLVQKIIDELYDAQSRGDLLAGVQSSLLNVSGDTAIVLRAGQAYLVPTANLTAAGLTFDDLNGVVVIDPQNGDLLSYDSVSDSWVNIAVGGFVTLDTDQTITGTKIFSNPLLIQSGSNPVFIIKTTDNTAAFNFRNVFNEDQAGIILDTPANKLSIATRADNTDIEIAPHGTGGVTLPNVAGGTGDVLMLNASNRVVKGSGGVSQSNGTFVPTLVDNGGGYTYALSSALGFYIKTGKMVFISVNIGVVSTSGSQLGGLVIGNLPFKSEASSGNISAVILSKMTGTNWSSSLLNRLSSEVVTNSTTIGFSTLTESVGNFAPSIDSGTIRLSATYYTD